MASFGPGSACQSFAARSWSWLWSGTTANEDEAELPLPPRPAVPLQGRGEERFECCGGSLLLCYGCGQHFKLWIRLQTHKRESCPASAQPKVDCPSCGTKVIQRHLKRHQESKRCQAARRE